MKVSGSQLFIVFASTVVIFTILNYQAFADDKQKWFSESSETVYTNFIKVLAGVLVSIPEPPKNITDSVKTVMRELFNGQPEREGYFSYLGNSMLRVYQTPLKGQVDNMLAIIIAMSDPESQMVANARVVRDFLISPEAEKTYEDIENYVKNLFQPVVNVPQPSNHEQNMELSPSFHRPANKNRMKKSNN